MSVNENNFPGEDREQVPSPAANDWGSESQNAQPSEENVGSGDNTRELPQNAALVDYADRNAQLFHAPDGQVYATVEVAEHNETYPVESISFKDWLVMQFFRDRGRAPSSGVLTDALNTIRAKAVFNGEEIPVFVRVAQHGADVYIDLANDAGEAIQVTPLGWQVISNPPVKFIRSNNSAPLPYPTSGGSVHELRRFFNVDEEHFKLIVGWLIGALNPQGPYPVLEVNGWQGSAKSTSTRLLVILSDPAVVSLRALPGNKRDLAIAASRRWVLAYDNVSYIKAEISDALCRLSTGGGFGTRKLYTDGEEMIFDAKRPQILNGINAVASRGDLQERSLQVLLKPIPPDERRQEREFWREFEEAWSRILGALLDAVSCALRKRDEVCLEEFPRMADFAAWVTAAEEALGWEPGDFMRAYEGNRRDASEALLENDIVAIAIRNLVDRCSDGEWSGTSGKLLETLNYWASEETMRSKAWPKVPNHLSRHLNRIAPALKEAGIEFEGAGREGTQSSRIKTLRKVPRENVPGSGGQTTKDRGGASEQSPHAAEDEDRFAIAGVHDDLDDPEEVIEDYLGKLTKLSWQRAETVFAAEESYEEGIVEKDPVAHKLRHNVGIYHRDISQFQYYPDASPLAITAEDVLEWKPKNKTAEEVRLAGWPSTPAEMSAHLRKLIPLLQAKPRRFWDPGFSEWYAARGMYYPVDDEKECKEAHLHAELWKKDDSSEELWALVAFHKGRRPPEEAIERAVWSRVTRRDWEIKLDTSSDDDFRFQA